ncbi:hypothetical protein ACPER7_15640 [Acinetobacter dispersus]|uniref:RipA family octameric membrane protein n=1 Tax=Acinetobacter dispersus TaxID=70348 RepID=UPI003C2CD43A
MPIKKIIDKINKKLDKNFFNEEEKNKDLLEKERRLKRIYEVAIETRNFEISQLVQRNNFFMIFQGVLIACIINSNNTVPLIHTIISIVGIGISFYQMQAASGAKFWQEYWEIEVNKSERELKKFYLLQHKDFHQLFDKKTEDVQRAVYERVFDKKLNKYSLFWAKHYNSFFYKLLKTYNPFTYIRNRILTKPSVSKIPIQTGRFLLCTWLIVLFFTTKIGENTYYYLKNFGLINGLPGKSITNIDIRNQKITNRKDSFDDSNEIKVKNGIIVN